jgi:GNAT superfamily N-acetyltransferase
VIDRLPEGFAARPLGRDDLEAVYRLEAECEAFDDGVAEFAISDVESGWNRPTFDLATMSVGYERRHTSWILRIGLDDEPTSPTLPDGFVFRGYRPGVDELQIFDVLETAFSAWEGREPNVFEDWRAQFVDRDEVRRSCRSSSPTASGSSGSPSTTTTQAMRRDGCGQLAVGPTHAGRGIGRALLGESFHRFRTMGRRARGLSTDSRTGALGLYEHVGMHAARVTPTGRSCLDEAAGPPRAPAASEVA